MKVSLLMLFLLAVGVRSRPTNLNMDINDIIYQRVRPEIRKRTAYEVAASDGYVKLDSMESPYIWPESVRNDWLSELRDIEINRYPDALGSRLCDSIRVWATLRDSSGILLGNGSDELIQMIMMTVGGPIMAPVPTFGMYKMIAEALGLSFIGVPLMKDFSLDMQQMVKNIDAHNPSCVFIAYPNNPTGNLFDYSAIQDLIKITRGLVIIDEAYYPFSRKTFVSELHENNNLAVLRTFSKFGLAGLRLGFLVAPDLWIKEINKIRLPYNINTLTQISARFAIRKDSWFQDCAETIREEQQCLYKRLEKISAVKVFPSASNFILFRLLEHDADIIFADLIQQKILIRNMSGTDESLANCLRVTVGTSDENEKFIQALQFAIQD